MRVPYFRAKDKDSDLFVEGFYVEFPEHSDLNKECRLVHAIMVVVPDTNAVSNFPMLGMMGGNSQQAIQDILGKRNTLNICTIDVSTLQQIGEVEIGGQLFRPEAYIKNPHSSIVLG